MPSVMLRHTVKRRDMAVLLKILSDYGMLSAIKIMLRRSKMELKKNIRVGRTYEDIINATDSIWICGKKVEEAEIVKQMPKDEMLEEEE